MSFRHVVGWIVTILLWLLGAAFVFVSLNLYDVYLTSIRVRAAVLVLAGGVLILGLLLRYGFWSRRRIAGKLLVLLWCLPPIAMASATAILHLNKHRTLHAEGKAALELGRRFVVGYSSYDEIAPLVSKGLVAGVYISHRNIKGRTAEALRQEIASLQDLRRAANLPPLIVAADQEGGIVSHLSPPLTRLPALSTLAALPVEERARKAEDFGRIHALELASLGITLNLAPVVDLQPGWSRNRFDFHSLINRRAISADPAVTTDIAAAYLRGLQAAGVTGTVKHFPGLGRVREDTHHFRARLETPIAELEALRLDTVPADAGANGSLFDGRARRRQRDRSRARGVSLGGRHQRRHPGQMGIRGHRHDRRSRDGAHLPVWHLCRDRRSAQCGR